MLTSPAVASRPLLILVGVAALVFLSAAAAADEPFRITYDQRSDATHTILSGRIANDARLDALDVYVTAEAVDANKQVVASGVSFVAPTIPAHGSAPFVVKVPRVSGAAGFRAKVSSFRFGLAGQSP